MMGKGAHEFVTAGTISFLFPVTSTNWADANARTGMPSRLTMHRRKFQLSEKL